MSSKPATEAVWLQLSNDLRRFIRRRIADDHAAEDMLQETFLRIHKSIGQINAADRLVAWVYRIARNVIHDYYRMLSSDVSLANAEPADERQPRSCGRAWVNEWLTEMVRQLPESYRYAVQLSEIEGLAQREVARRLRLSYSGTKSRIQRGRAMLREALDQCCSFQFDGRGNLIDCDPRPERVVCRNCDSLAVPPPK